MTHVCPPWGKVGDIHVCPLWGEVGDIHVCPPWDEVRDIPVTSFTISWQIVNLEIVFIIAKITTDF